MMAARVLVLSVVALVSGPLSRSAAGAGDVPVFVGGTIPPQDREALFALGVKGVFTNDAPLERMIDELARALA